MKFIEKTIIGKTFKYKYIETDDPSANDYFNDLDSFLSEHNNYFGTNYKNINEFNLGEPHRIIKVL